MYVCVHIFKYIIAIIILLSLLWEIKRILKFGISVAYHLRLEVAYYNDRYSLTQLLSFLIIIIFEIICNFNA